MKKLVLMIGAGSGIGKTIAALFAKHCTQFLLADFKYEDIESSCLTRELDMSSSSLVIKPMEEAE